jgi:hypothetical protein
MISRYTCKDVPLRHGEDDEEKNGRLSLERVDRNSARQVGKCYLKPGNGGTLLVRSCYLLFLCCKIRQGMTFFLEIDWAPIYVLQHMLCLILTLCYISWRKQIYK